MATKWNEDDECWEIFVDDLDYRTVTIAELGPNKISIHMLRINHANPVPIWLTREEGEEVALAILATLKDMDEENE